jgi:hypothetical protein
MQFISDFIKMRRSVDRVAGGTHYNSGRPPLWSSCQSFSLQIKRFGFNSQRYQIYWEVVGLEEVPLSLVNKIEMLERKSSVSGLESREYGRRDPSRWSRGTLYPQKLALNFADKLRSLVRYSSLSDSGRGVLYCNSEYYILSRLLFAWCPEL